MIDKNLNFIKEVANYFMDFLETDFHKRRTPKRSIKNRNEDNLLVGLNLGKYPTFNKIVWKSINQAFDKNKNILSSVEKGVYKTNIPKDLLDLIKLQTKKLSAKQIEKIIKQISNELEKASVTYKQQYDLGFNQVLESTAKIIKETLVLPFIKDIEKPLENLNLADENTVYLMEEELTAILSKPLENKISEILKLLLVKEKVNSVAELRSVFDFDEVKQLITEFFENFGVADVFAEIFEMDRNRNILDKTEFYLYFCDITFNSAKYPIFYIPFTLEKQNDVLNIEFDSQVYINKKALEYIVQEYNQENGKKGHLKSINERIIYLAQHKEDLKEVLNNILNELINFFELDLNIDITSPEAQVSKGLWTRISNSLYISLFDKSDESLINDYEEILQLLEVEDSLIASAFNKLIDDFIHKNPESSNEKIEDEWDNLDTSDKLVFGSPIPLNSEQRQIISAINEEGCKYITVEGPPGTGKSHTITAIAFNAILKNQSVLVLSDKKEALDVVEDKISETMDKVRLDKKFQNPILRLGRTGNTYNQILSTASIENIKVHYRAVRKDYETLEENIDKSKNTLIEDLNAEILAYNDINIEEIKEILQLEFEGLKSYPVDIEEVLKNPDSAIELEEFRKIFKKLRETVFTDNSDARSSKSINFSSKEIKDLASLQRLLNSLSVIYSDARKLKESFNSQIEQVKYFKDFSDDDVGRLKKFIGDYENSKTWIFGYLLKSAKINELNKEFKEAFPESQIEYPHKSLDILKNVLKIYETALEYKKSYSGDFKLVDYIQLIHKLLSEERVSDLQDMFHLSEDINYLNEKLADYPNTVIKARINFQNLDEFCNNKLFNMSDSEFNNLIRFITLKQKIVKNFLSIPDLNYEVQKNNIENLVTAQMTYLLDQRLINFYENNKATARTLRDIIRTKQKFPKEEFSKLKESFPCIIAGIRDYAEFIPLEPEIFDLVIIDEASQVSIAQAFPALLRGKKIIILGDKKQFSNIKAAQARSDTNKEYLNNLESNFKRNVSEDQTKLVKLKKFDIKTSILEFFEFISNYNTQLHKHFRGYKETISYSNKYFYQDSLQVMKIRGKPIDEVLKFNFIKHDGKNEVSPNTNTLEVDSIISELRKLKNSGSKVTVGIITPHTNQQKLLMETISKIPERDYLFDELKLKIMTFDTCQGEERDIIYYSMVATNESDRLWGVFIKDLNNVDLEEDGQIKAQRLNVGFSRSKECMHFVLSKPLDKYSGSVGDALRHYAVCLEDAKKEREIDEVDHSSQMEPKVLNWFYQTDFWKQNKEQIDFMPQFELGKYLRQLDRSYNHPSYKVDFLLIYKEEISNREHKIIIEYDGFEEHFKSLDGIDEFNYQYYYSDGDVYRQKVLEGYGYKFLRINRFNVGNNPISTLDERINNLIKEKFSGNSLLKNIHKMAEGLQNGEMKECPKCKEIREIKDFKDSFLTTGFGRFCKYCKQPTIAMFKESIGKAEDNNYNTSSKICPKCSSSMVLRNGRYGQFYGCSKFPYCRGTKPYNSIN